MEDDTVRRKRILQRYGSFGTGTIRQKKWLEMKTKEGWKPCEHKCPEHGIWKHDILKDVVCHNPVFHSCDKCTQWPLGTRAAKIDKIKEDKDINEMKGDEEKFKERQELRKKHHPFPIDSHYMFDNNKNKEHFIGPSGGPYNNNEHCAYCSGEFKKGEETVKAMGAYPVHKDCENGWSIRNTARKILKK
jgi:hypothetical protein